MSAPLLGLTLPAFVDDPEVPLRVARAADDAGVDGVFTFDHLFRLGSDGRPRPALEMEAMLGALAAATTRVALGPLVARASLRPAATLAAGFDTAARLAPGRFIGALGAGDGESTVEDSAFGTLPAGDRLAVLAEVLARVTGRGYPVWVGGSSPAVRRLAAARADGWNRWGAEVAAFSPEDQRTVFEDEVGELWRDLAAAGRDRDGFAVSWGGLAVLAPTDEAALAKWERFGARVDVVWGGPPRLAAFCRRLAGAGAAWAVFGPLDSSDPANAGVLAAVRQELQTDL